MKKTVIVTGGPHGIGRAIADSFPLEEYHVYSVGSDIADVRNPDEIARFLAHGPAVPDILVNNAGVISLGMIDEIKDKFIKDMIDTNLYGTLNWTRAVLPGMLDRGSGYIINIASLRAKYPAEGKAIYSATKAAILSLTKSINIEYASKGTRSTAICPDTVDTDMGRRLDSGVLINPPVIGDTVQWLIHLPENVIVDEVVMKRRDRYD